MDKAMEYILKIAEVKSLSKAAEELFVSQPALSAILKKEENAYGVTFFNRSFKPFIITEEGKRYIATAKKIRKLEDNLRRDLSCSSNRIRIGASAYFGANILPPLIEDFKKMTKFGKTCKIEVIEGDEKNLFKKFSNGETDFTITVESSYDRNAVKTILRQEEILLAMPEALCIKGSDIQDVSPLPIKLYGSSAEINISASLKAIQKQPMILLTKGNDLYGRAKKILRKWHLAPKNILYMSQLQSAFLAAKSGQGTTFIREDLIRFMDSSGLVFFKFDDQLSKRNIRLIFKSINNMNSFKKAFFLFCKENFKNY